MKVGKPTIKDKATEGWTRITWSPDLSKFGMESLDDDICALFTRRAYDMAGCTHHSVKVYLNGKRIATNNFSNYVDLFLGPKLGGLPRTFEKVTDRWEVAIAPSDDGFQQVSFVNSIATTKGGTHIGHVADQVVERVLEHLKKKHKGMEKVLKPNHVKSHMKIFVNCLIENPAFDSQTKEYHTLKPSAFGSKCTFSDKFYKDVLNCGVLESVLSFAQSKQSKDLKKTDGTKKTRLTGIPKLDDANEAGGKSGYKCTLIITEGDSAKALAVSGLSVIGRDYYGVFPLRGKLLNVRDANHSTIMANKEISELKQILGLQQGKNYDDLAARKALRYGHLMIMTDQDHDGSHIKGLIINFLHCYWPGLLKSGDFLREFVTPIVKVTRNRSSMPFFTLKEYNDWRDNVGGAASSYSIKYYKGLGTSTSVEAKQYFSDLPQHELTFEWTGEGNTALIERAFAKSQADQRKEWLRGYDPNVFVDHSSDTISYADFIDKELIHFSNADNVRSIPSMVDGLKPGQRKILFSCFKRGKSIIKNEIKVAQLAGYVSEHSAYHHGETSLAGTIVGMAQTFVGSNNIALLYPAGQFGTRLLGGKDAASPRYIFTKLPTLTRLIFHPDDDGLLEYLEDDGQSIEPKFYVPVLPLVLINGADGIGTGWSSNVPNYNPRDVVSNLKKLMEGEAIEAMTPWYRGFNGTIVPADVKNTSFTTFGTVAKLDDSTVHISELPIRKWTQDYKDAVLEPMLTGAPAGDKDGAKSAGAPMVDDVREHHTDTTVSFSVRFSGGAAVLGELESKGTLHKTLKLSSSISTTNMTLFDERGRIVRHESPEAILRDFYAIRLEFYEKRKLHLCEVLTKEWTKLDNRVRFILAVVDGKLKISNVKKDILVATLHKEGYATFEPAAKKKRADDDDDKDDDDDAVDVDAKPAGGKAGAPTAKGYDYLLGMALWSLTLEKVTQLQGELQAKDAELQALLAKTPKQLWSTDLDAFMVGYEQWEVELAAAEAGAPKAKGKGKAPAKKAPKKKAGSDDDDDDDDDFMDDGSDDDWDAKKKKKAPPKGKAAASKAAAPPPPPNTANAVPIAVPMVALKRKAPAKESEADTASEADSVAPAVPLAAKAKAGKAKAPAVPTVKEDEESDDDAPGLSLMERLAARTKAGVASSTLEELAGPSPAARPAVKRMCDKASPIAGALKAAKPAKAAAKKAPAKKKVESSDDDDYDEDDEDEAAAPAPSARAAARPGRAAAQKKYVDSDDDDGDESEEESEEESPPPKPKAKAPAARKPAAKAPPPPMAEEESDDDFAFEEPKAKPAPKAKAPTKPKAAAAKPAAKKAPPKKKAASSDDDYDEDDEEAAAPAPSARAAARPGRAAAQKKYVQSDDESMDDASDDDY